MCCIGSLASQWHHDTAMMAHQIAYAIKQICMKNQIFGFDFFAGFGALAFTLDFQGYNLADIDLCGWTSYERTGSCELVFECCAISPIL